eukprot:gb/GEZJ01007441.1/.p2 GENE.gb/GEZJ01007441.1/~~gb/GEZJ01007441.1/.p2  ORF type:complete len:112 (+),score=7.02 gb/GEZJ01007441.1/:158-493(+)
MAFIEPTSPTPPTLDPGSVPTPSPVFPCATPNLPPSANQGKKFKRFRFTDAYDTSLQKPLLHVVSTFQSGGTQRRFAKQYWGSFSLRFLAQLLRTFIALRQKLSKRGSVRW